ncbi:P-loop containing nucleoside triphosphate hydrolase protein [Apiospora saccharicola]
MEPGDTDPAGENVNSSISQDRTTGQHVQEESDYKLLSGSVSARLRLEELHMQYKLLEQQNKRHLMMVRRAQAAIPSGEVKRSHQEAFAESYSSREESGDDHGIQDSDDSDYSNQDGKYSEASKSPRESSSRPRPKRLKETDDQPSGPAYYILHRVVCSAGYDLCHRRIYRDEPCKTAIRRTHHLAGSSLVADLDDFIGSCGDISFIVFRDFYCEMGTRSSLVERAGQQGTKHFREVISIVSEELHATIQRISKFAPDRDSYGSGSSYPAEACVSPALSMSPTEYTLRFLYHHRQDLVAATSVAADGCSLKVFTSYVLSNPDTMYMRCDDLFSRGLVTHDTLSWLFHPNEIVVLSQEPLVMAYILSEFPKEGSQLDFTCWNWGYDGHWLRRKEKSFTMNLPAYGELRIDTLKLYPLQYATEETRQRLADNGDKFWSFSQPKFVSYQGPDYLGDRVFMLDYQVYSKFHSMSEALTFSSKAKASYDKWPESIPNTAQLSPVHRLLLPPGIHGFYLKEKKWIHLLVDQIQPITWNKTAFDRLVLPKRTKSLVKALVIVRKQKLESTSAYSLEKAKQDDIIAGKGNGLIMLLHGGPGTGKTLTAGTNPEAVEKYLNSVLHLGKKWNCGKLPYPNSPVKLPYYLLLLDEADIFLEERSLSDLERNSLVSVFLRTLEYYEGVLILTSNRVGTFDEAFKSRIQLALHYRPLDGPSRRKIWNNFFNMMRESDGGGGDKEAVDFDDIAAHMDELAAYEMNGRQIRNSLATARQLAIFEQETLDWDRIKDAIEVASDFNTYIKDVHGHTDEQWSRDNKVR